MWAGALIITVVVLAYAFSLAPVGRIGLLVGVLLTVALLVIGAWRLPTTRLLPIWGQVAETVLLPLLPLFLRYMGMKWVLALGMFAWGLRYAFFAVGHPYELVFLGILLHGICFDFFFAAGFIHVDNKAPRDIRGSAQALFTFLTYGVGMWLGSVFSGILGDAVTADVVDNVTGQIVKVKDWMLFWLVPAAGVLICFVVFVLFFRESKKPKVRATEELPMLPPA